MKLGFLKGFINKKIFIILCIFILLVISTLLFLNHGNSVEKIRKSVLKLNVYDENGEIIQTGSGFVTFTKDILITNAHVITGGTKIEAVSESDERVFVDGAIYYSQDEDVAILKLNKKNNIKVLNISSFYKSGEKCIAIGSPLGIKNSVSDGIISNILDDNVIQHTAPISSGNSGGALFNSKGKVIGMNTATITEGQNMNLAISINNIKKLYELSKNNKVISIEKIQLNDDELIQNSLLNNNAGEKIIKEIKNATDKKIATRNSIGEFKSIPQLSKFYENKDYYSRALVVWGNDDYEELENPNECNEITIEGKTVKSCSTDRILKKEANLIEFILLETKGINDELYNYSKDILLERAYEGLSVSSGEFWYSYSNDYLNAYKNPIIGKYKNYIYMIISKNDASSKKIIELIKQLP